jgi:hypothetical protein
MNSRPGNTLGQWKEYPPLSLPGWILFNGTRNFELLPDASGLNRSSDSSSNINFPWGCSASILKAEEHRKE